MKNIRKEKTHGFTLFVALIVTSLLLAIGFSLSNIVLKQLIFSQSSRESQIAFYAADSGAECALFWDRKNQFGTTTVYGAFATSTELIGGNPTPYDIYCGYGTDGTGRIGNFQKLIVGDAATTTFNIDYQDVVTGSGLNSQKGICSKVSVSKWIDLSIPSSPVERTTVDSRGYDVGFTGLVGLTGVYPGQVWEQGSCNISSNRVVERAIRLDY